MTKIILECVPPEEQRFVCYSELYSGDWQFDGEGNIVIRVTGEDVWCDPDAFLVALHELVEARLCFASGVTQSMVDTFDTNWSGALGEEPGDSPDAPYRSQHRSACLIEFFMAKLMGIDDYGIMR